MYYLRKKVVALEKDVFVFEYNTEGYFASGTMLFC